MTEIISEISCLITDQEQRFWGNAESKFSCGWPLKWAISVAAWKTNAMDHSVDSVKIIPRIVRTITEISALWISFSYENVTDQAHWTIWGEPPSEFWFSSDLGNNLSTPSSRRLGANSQESPLVMNVIRPLGGAINRIRYFSFPQSMTILKRCWAKM